MWEVSFFILFVHLGSWCRCRECGKKGYTTDNCPKEQHVSVIHQGINTSWQKMLGLLRREDTAINISSLTAQNSIAQLSWKGPSPEILNTHSMNWTHTAAHGCVLAPLSTSSIKNAREVITTPLPVAPCFLLLARCMGLVLTMSLGQLIPWMCQAVSAGFVAPGGTLCCWDLLTRSPAGVTQPRGLGRMQWCSDAAAGYECCSTGTVSWTCNDILGGWGPPLPHTFITSQSPGTSEMWGLWPAWLYFVWS